jgi:hypothetical protein
MKKIGTNITRKLWSTLLLEDILLMETEDVATCEQSIVITIH